MRALWPQSPRPSAPKPPSPVWRWAVPLLLIALGWLFGVPGALAAEDLDTVLEGFSDESETETEVLEGFEADETAASGDSDATEAVLEGFDTRPEEKRAVDGSPRTNWPGWLSVDGHLRLAATVNTAHQAPEGDETDWRGLSRLLGEGQLAGDIRMPDNWRL